MTHSDEYDFQPISPGALKDKVAELNNMNTLPYKRKNPPISPESTELSKKDKKLIKKDLKNKTKSEQKAAVKIVVSPSKF